MSKFTKKKRNNIITIACVALAALALVALFSNIGRTPNEDNLLSLKFEDYKSDYGYKIIANDDGSLKFDGEFKDPLLERETVEYETIILKPGTYTISTGTNGNPYTYCMAVSYCNDDNENVFAYSDSGAASTFTLSQQQEVTVFIFVNNGADIDGVTIYPTLSSGKTPIKFYS